MTDRLPIDVAVVRTGVANLASVLAGLHRAGAAPRIAESAADFAAAPAAFLPGVGAFTPGLAALRDGGYDRALIDRVAADRPTFAICLGLQLLLDGSEEAEAADATGLGVVPGRATRFPDAVRVPQLGWNRITADPDCAVLDSGYAYFANSYRLVERPAGFAVATADHGGDFVAAVERGRLVACQFHPELSGAFGHGVLTRWLAGAVEEVSRC